MHIFIILVGLKVHVKLCLQGVGWGLKSETIKQLGIHLIAISFVTGKGFPHFSF